jgi:hypothetical protein
LNRARWGLLTVMLVAAGCENEAPLATEPVAATAVVSEPMPASQATERIQTAAEREANWARYLGRWEYRQANPGLPCDVDPQGEILEFSREQDSIKLVYWGVEREGDHGLFFSVISTLAFMDPSGEVTFTVGDRAFFHERPTSVDVDRTMSSGCCGDELHYTGRIEGERLVLHCRDSGYGCPDTRLEFMRDAWKCQENVR